jgi:hypothetical protein
MPSATQAYRKLASWKGFFVRAALFADEHCLVSVRSSGYEERVKRLYYKDIRAVVVSKSPRFGASRAMILGVLLLLLTILLVPSFYRPLMKVLWTFAGTLVLAWLYISARASCRFRVFTAVSAEELPSVRRSWTASKVLARLTPLIEASQGTLPAGWKESLTGGQPILIAQLPAKLQQEGDPTQRIESQSGRLAASGVLVASLLLDVVLTAWDLQRTQPLPGWIGSALALIEAAAAVWVLIRNRGADISLQRLGAVVLIFLGLAFYSQYGVAAFASAQLKRPLRQGELRSTPVYRKLLETYTGGCLVLGVMGAFLTLVGPTPRRQRVLVE